MDHIVIQFLIFLGATILFYTVDTLFYFPTSSAQEFLFFHILANNCYFLGFFLAVAILVGVTYYLTVILTCVSLINNDGEHFFTCSLVICISSSEKCLVKSIAHFKIRLL